MPNRRDVLTALLAGLSTAMAPRHLSARAHAGSGTDADLWLNRLSFGANDAARAEFATLGPKGWLDHQLALPPTDSALDARLRATHLRIAHDAGQDATGDWPARDELRPLTALWSLPEATLPLIDWSRPMAYAERIRPAEEVIAASLIRAVHAPAQLREVMTQFWHDHFNVHARKDEYVAAFFPAYDTGLRTHALGRFRDLLGHVATSPSMLVYLTNDESRASPANENFARELLELHTLGAAAYAHIPDMDGPRTADGLALHYSDNDVWEVARCFTGWTLGDGRWVADGLATPRTGQMAYVEAWHDPYQKRILGRDFAPHGAPMADGEAVLDLLASHPATARHVCDKIARRLLADDPDPGLIDRLAAVFLAKAQAADQIAQVIRALVADPAFAAGPAKMRRPFEFLAALLRATGAEVAATDLGWAHELARAGWRQHDFSPPNGHPDRAEDWSAGVVMLRLAEMALHAHEPWMGWVSTPLSDLMPRGPLSVVEMADLWHHRLTGHSVPDPAALAEALSGIGIDPGWQPEADEDRAAISAGLVAAAALTPAFLFR